jgi:hypothetical protein
MVVDSVRNNNRILYEDMNLSERIWQKLKPYAEEKIGNQLCYRIKRTLRFYKYEAGQEFKIKRHRVLAEATSAMKRNRAITLLLSYLMMIMKGEILHSKNWRFGQSKGQHSTFYMT